MLLSVRVSVKTIALHGVASSAEAEQELRGCQYYGLDYAINFLLRYF